MSRRDNTARRCVQCRMLDGCICALIPRLETRTRVVLAIHEDEARKPTNTGLLAARCLTNSEVLVVDARFTAPSLENAAVLADVDGAVDVRERKPATLVVPDGTWRQARRIRRKLALPCVTLPKGAPTEYTLRSDAHEGGLATLEAIARALALLEGPEVEAALMVPFRALIAHTLATRQGWGKAATSDDDNARV